MTQPALSLANVSDTGTNYAELSRTSETGLLLPQSVPQIGTPIPWALQTNGVTAEGNRKTLRVPLTSSHQFFRLTTQ